MIEIIPNWHPIFVHFTIALLSISTLFYVLGFLLKKEQLLIMARWNLWTGVLVTVGTLLAGLYAYNTVVHDDISHIAMTNHRNWAFITATAFVLLAVWAFLKQRQARAVSPLFIILMVLASGLLITTGYKGGDVVYRYGLGVLSTPEMRKHALIQHSYETNVIEQEEKHHNHGDHRH